jgi:SAM-dependent methyltransferase
MALLDEIQRYWDRDAATYDEAPGHRPRSPAVQAAWTAALERLLPAAPARVLDCGAGTGFLSLIAARLGHRVTALDLSREMLARLEAAAEAEHLRIDVVVGPAGEPPSGFDIVMERHLLWTLPDPVGTLRAWRAAAPGGRLVVIESRWGDTDPLERLRSRGREMVRRLRGRAPNHHAPYPTDVLAALPLGTGTDPARIVELVADAGWSVPRLERLRDVEWAMLQELPPAERLLGITSRFAVVAV